MSLAIRYSKDNGPLFMPLDGLVVRRVSDAETMAALQNRTSGEMGQRFAAGHRAYVAFLHGEAAAWGWAATREATIGELATHFFVQNRQRYLWNFVTRAEYRGRGIYPRLLDAIVRAEAAEADAFWIAYAPENHASGAGIHKAGFRTVARLSFDDALQPVVQILADGGEAAAELLGLPAVNTRVSQCWRCARANVTSAACREESCCCDYQRPQTACAN